jgi:hypothetical protein
LKDDPYVISPLNMPSSQSRSVWLSLEWELRLIQATCGIPSALLSGGSGTRVLPSTFEIVVWRPAPIKLANLLCPRVPSSEST